MTDRTSAGATTMISRASLSGAVILLVSLIFHLGLPQLAIVGELGRFLWTRFHAAAFYLPVYLVLVAYLIGRRFRMDRFLALNLTFFPFLTLATLFSIMFKTPEQYPALSRLFVAGFSLDGAVVFLFLLFFAECLTILRFVLMRKASSGEIRAEVENDAELSPGAESRLVGLLRPADSMRRADDELGPISLGDEDGPGAFADADADAEDLPAADAEDLPTDDAEPALQGADEEDDDFDDGLPAVELTPLELDALQAGFDDVVNKDDLDDEDLDYLSLEELGGQDDVADSVEAWDDDDSFDKAREAVEEEFSVVFTNGTFVASPDRGDTAEDNADPHDREHPEDFQPVDQWPENQWPDDKAEATVAKTEAPKHAAHSAGLKKKRRGSYAVPTDGILEDYPNRRFWEIDETTKEAAETLRVTLEEFHIQAEVTGIRKGPVITMFEVLPARGVKLNKIVNLADNIALRLAASSVRIVAPIPGKHAVGIEIPNKNRAIVSFGDLVADEDFQAGKARIPIALGKDIPGENQIVDLARMPHLLIAGATGSGKSVCVNSIICSILYRRSPQDIKMILIDPKIVELKFYNDIPHLLTPVITDPKRAFQALQYAIYEMENRYSLLDQIGVRDISAYNAKIKAKKLALQPMPYIVIVVDEFADLMATSGKELETTLARLAAMSRAVGIHLVIATQRPSTDVISGLIKANFPSRIAFMVSSRIESRIIIDTSGADFLLGQGDMLFTSAWDPFPKRIQGAFLSDDEVERVTDYVKTLGEPDYIDDEIFIDEEDEDSFQGELEDPLLEKAIQIVVSSKKASASYLQRRLKVGYNRAARMVEEMERLGIVGPQNGSKARDIISVPDGASVG